MQWHLSFIASGWQSIGKALYWWYSFQDMEFLCWSLLTMKDTRSLLDAGMSDSVPVWG
jgi:hypothetical protein